MVSPTKTGIIFALLNHSAMTLMLIVFGLISLMVLPFINRNVTLPEKANTETGS